MIKKFMLIIFLIFIFSIPANAQTKYQRGFASHTFTTDAQVFTQDVILYGYDIRVPDGSSTFVTLYDTSKWRGHAWDLTVGEYITTATGSLISPKENFKTDGAEKRFPIPIQTTAGGVYMDIDCNVAPEITFYYDLSRYGGGDPF